MVEEKRISQSEENWQALPGRLRGRGDFLRDRGRIKDAELMFDAATEIEGLRADLTALRLSCDNGCPNDD